jgi:CRP-like cAMP-binding protein
LLSRAGDPGLAFYFILSGTVRILIDRPGGEEAVNEMHAGDSFGELALLDAHNVRTASVVCKVCGTRQSKLKTRLLLSFCASTSLNST